MQEIQKKNPGAARYLPLILTSFIVAADQFTKYLVVRYIPVNTIAEEYFGDFLRIVHVRNTAIAFSIGAGLPDAVKKVLFIILPMVLLVILMGMMIKSSQLSTLQRWAAAGIAGGGIGNLIDRVFRTAGVVDFIDVKFYGIFGLERWPVFNVADSSIVVFGILIFASVLFSRQAKDSALPAQRKEEP